MTDERRLARAAGRSDDLERPGDEEAFQKSFLRLLERRVAIYTMGDSSSVPTGQAAELFRSICYVLGIDPEEGLIPEDLLGVDLEQEFRRRLAGVERKVEATERLWADVCAAMPLIPNVALKDSLTAIRGFFKHYDHRSMAHDIPCSIDYPLCHPVEESLLGVDYIADYLRRLLIEARFLQLFEIAAVKRVLASASPDYVGLLVNLYEPVAVNTMGLALIGEDPRLLAIGDAERQAIAAALGPLGDAGRERMLREAAATGCDALGVSEEDDREYLSALVPELLPRIEVGLTYGGLGGVFVG